MLSSMPPETASEVEDVLHALGQESGMPTVLLTHVDGGAWSPWAVRDEARFGLEVGRRLEVETTLCHAVMREANGGLAIDDARRDARFANHPACRVYGVGAYVGVPFRLADGTVVGTLCAIDRSPHVGLVAALRLYRLFARLLAHEFELADEARRSLAALNSETENGMSRERFLAAVTHDLRTPLAAIEATAQVMKRRPDASLATMEGIKRILYSAERMGRLIDDLLDLARGRLGKGIPIRRHCVVDVKGFFTEVLNEAASAHGAELQTDLHLDRVDAQWDRDRITQCIDNILTNAFVHGTRGLPVKVTACCNNDVVVLQIVNGGEIPESCRGSLFDPFRGARTVRRGLGLGLFIADQIVRAHGGSIQLASRGGETYTVIELPLGA